MARKARAKVHRPLDPDTMGRMGQSRFGELCDGGKLIANDSLRADRMGWDYHVEFPLSHQRDAAPFDSRSKLPDMKIQVKTIWSDRSAVDIGLSAAERLARWDYPSFIVIMRMNMDRTYQDVYVIHLLDDNLARVLKALRQAEAEGSLSIKNKTISFGIERGIRTTLDGVELANTLRAAIGEQPDAYMTRKRDQLRNLGFEPRRHVGTFSLTAASEDEVLDVLLGLRKTQVSHFNADEVRFGIPLPQIRETNATIEIKPESRGPCEFIMTSAVGDRKRAIFGAEFYFASTTVVPEGSWKVRIHSPLIEVLCGRDDPDATFTIGVPPGTRLTLDDLIRVSRAQLIVASGPGTAFARTHGKRLLAFNIKEAPSLADQQAMTARIKFLTDLETMLGGIGLRDIKLHDDDIASNIGGINFGLRSQHTANGIAITLKVKPRVDGPQIPNETEGLFASKIILPDVTIALWASMRVAATPDEDGVALHCTDFSLRDLAVLGADETFDDFVAEASATSGLGLVIKTDRVNWSGRTEPEVAADDGHIPPRSTAS